MSLLHRCISCFDKTSGGLAKEIPLINVQLAKLQELLGEPGDDLMYEMYRLNHRQASLLQEYANEPIDLETYDCFLDCYVKENDN